MRSFLVAMLLGAALGSCAQPITDEFEEPDPLDPSKPIHEIGAIHPPGPMLDGVDRIYPGESEVACEPPADDGPCSLLCDPDRMLDEYVPEGTCVQFVCTMRDGAEHRLGGCR